MVRTFILPPAAANFCEVLRSYLDSKVSDGHTLTVEETQEMIDTYFAYAARALESDTPEKFWSVIRQQLHYLCYEVRRIQKSGCCVSYVDVIKKFKGLYEFCTDPNKELLLNNKNPFCRLERGSIVFVNQGQAIEWFIHNPIGVTIDVSYIQAVSSTSSAASRR